MVAISKFHTSTLVAVIGCGCWLLSMVAVTLDGWCCCFWLLVPVVGCWFLLMVPGCCWWFLVAVDGSCCQGWTKSKLCVSKNLTTINCPSKSKWLFSLIYITCWRCRFDDLLNCNSIFFVWLPYLNFTLLPSLS